MMLPLFGLHFPCFAYMGKHSKVFTLRVALRCYRTKDYVWEVIDALKVVLIVRTIGKLSMH